MCSEILHTERFEETGKNEDIKVKREMGGGGTRVSLTAIDSASKEIPRIAFSCI